MEFYAKKYKKLQYIYSAKTHIDLITQYFQTIRPHKITRVRKYFVEASKADEQKIFLAHGKPETKQVLGIRSDIEDFTWVGEQMTVKLCGALLVSFPPAFIMGKEDSKLQGVGGVSSSQSGSQSVNHLVSSCTLWCFIDLFSTGVRHGKGGSRAAGCG